MYMCAQTSDNESRFACNTSAPTTVLSHDNIAQVHTLLFWDDVLREREKTWSPGISTAALITTYMSLYSLYMLLRLQLCIPQRDPTHSHPDINTCNPVPTTNPCHLYTIYNVGSTSTHFDWPRVPRRRVDRSGNFRRMICTSRDKSIVVNQQWTKCIRWSIARWANTL